MKSNRTALVIVIAAVLIILLYLLFTVGGNKQVNWYTMYRESETQPYDLSVISKLLDNYFPLKKYEVLKKPISQTLPEDSTERSTYVFIGSSLYLNQDDNNRLYEFVRSGNSAFIACNHFSQGLLPHILGSEESYMEPLDQTFQQTVSLNFTHPSLRKTGGYWCDFIYEWKKENYQWSYFTDSVLTDSISPFVKLGTLNDNYTSFLKVPYGKGAFYLHTVPIIFTNYNMKRTEGREYAEKIFSNLPTGNIYWDEFSKVPQFGSGDHGSTETPLRYILSQESLRWAWYVLLGMVLLFLLFRAKRDQRIIPVMELNTNTSLEFIHTIGRLYFIQNDHRALALGQMKLFLSFIRGRYGLLTKSPDEVFIRKLTEKSQVGANNIRIILDEYKTIQNMDQITIDQLTSFHQLLQDFYSKCK